MRQTSSTGWTIFKLFKQKKRNLACLFSNKDYSQNLLYQNVFNKKEKEKGGESLKKRECQASESESPILADFQDYPFNFTQYAFKPYRSRARAG